MNVKQHPIARRNVLKALVAGVIASVSFKALGMSGENQKEVKEKMNINVIVRFEVKPEKVAEFTTILESVKADLPKVRGCVGVNIFRNSSASNKFTLVETWENEKLHQDHIAKLSNDGTWDMIVSHLSKDPESDYFIQI
ncbi:MAG: antibiotic biosynthesis monooxygenase [Gammaproteobacteria bacterium]|nr:antibiotic biosynthesis monooxygenase [Gammaproteobacteria bacterium]